MPPFTHLHCATSTSSASPIIYPGGYLQTFDGGAPMDVQAHGRASRLVSGGHSLRTIPP